MALSTGQRDAIIWMAYSQLDAYEQISLFSEHELFSKSQRVKPTMEYSSNLHVCQQTYKIELCDIQIR